MSASFSALSMVLALLQSQSASAFAPTGTLESPLYRTSINFRYIDDDDAGHRVNRSTRRSNATGTITETSRTEATSTANQHQTYTEASKIESIFSMSTHSSNHDSMPSWLRPSGVLADGKLAALRVIMRDSSLSHLEAEQVISAIREASSGNLDMISGAVDFCLVLVETMEMGVATLIAAAFHYCDAYAARSKQNEHSPSFSYLNYWDQAKKNNGHDDNARVIKIGQDAHQLIKDAARIKRAEMVASESLKFRPSPIESANIRKMLLSETHDWRALAIRSAACLYRLRGIYEHFEMTSDEAYPHSDLRVAMEALEIHAPLASRLGMHRLKNEIEGAAFRILYRRQYDKVTGLTRQSKPCPSVNDGMRLVLNKVTNEVQDLLETDPYFLKYAQDVKVAARIKEPYSLWRKMLKLKAESVLDVPDALALRVVFDAKKMDPDENAEVTSAREKALCYYIQKICTTKFSPLKDGRFKDYIAHPKPNGYQSLHYAAVTNFENDAWQFEIQVRSSEMHQVAEFGLAAHWDYKGTQEAPSSASTPPHYAFKLDNSSDAYLRSVQEWHWQQAQARGSWAAESSASPLFGEKDAGTAERLRARDAHLAPYLDALMKDQSNLAREHVFIFLSCNEEDDGQILELPAGACVLDALRESERTLGFRTNRLLEQQIVHNGSFTTVTKRLRNGDIITIPNASAAAVSP